MADLGWPTNKRRNRVTHLVAERKKHVGPIVSYSQVACFRLKGNLVRKVTFKRINQGRPTIVGTDYVLPLCFFDAQNLIPYAAERCHVKRIPEVWS